MIDVQTRLKMLPYLSSLTGEWWARLTTEELHEIIFLAHGELNYRENGEKNENS